MATGTDKFLNYNGLVKLIGLIKKRINDAISWKSNVFVKDVVGIHTTNQQDSGEANVTFVEQSAVVTLGKLDGTGTDTTHNITFTDARYDPVDPSRGAGLMSVEDKVKLDNLGATGANKGANLVKYDSTANTTAGSVAEAIKNLQGAVGGGDLVKQIDTASQESQISGNINYNPNTVRTGNYTKANGDPATFTYYETTYDAATPDTGSGQAIVAGKTGLMSSADKTKLDGVATGAQVNVIEGVQLNGTDLTLTNKKANVQIKANGSLLGVTNGAVDITKSSLGLGNVDNTSDANKPISIATQQALNGKLSFVEYAGMSSDFMDGSAISNENYDILHSITTEPGTLLRVGDNGIASVWDDGTYLNIVILGQNDEGILQWSAIDKSSNPDGDYHDIADYFALNTTYLVKSVNGQTGNVTINSSISLSSNINIDGSSKSNVQDALTALNTLAAANKSAISTLQSGGLTREVVTALPTGTSIKTNVIYMILASNDPLDGGDPSTGATTTPYGTNNNSYNEYMYINNAWERIGSTEVNLDIDPITDDEIDTAWSTTVAAA